MSHRKSGLRPIVLASLFAFCSAPAFAERPMTVDDAGTLERGGAKLEFGWSRDDAVRGYDLSLTPPSNTSRRKARSTRRPARHRKQPCIYAGVGLSRAGGWPAAA